MTAPGRGERGGGAWRGRLHLLTVNELLAVLRVLTDAHVALLQPLLLEERLVVLLRDPRDGKGQRRLLLVAVLPEPVRRRLLPMEEPDRRRGRGVRLQRHLLVDGARLPAGEDVLDALRRRILAGQGGFLEVSGLLVGDHGACDVVVRRDDALDLVVGLG